MDFKTRLKDLLIRKRVLVNRFVIVLVVIFLAHPRNRLFFTTGLLIALAGSFLRVWAKGTLGSYPNHLVAIGPYRFVRHPMYWGTAAQAVGLWIACLSWAWMFTFLFLGTVLACYFLFVYKEAILLEEEQLYKKFASEWSHYARRVSALMPEKETLKTFELADIKTFRWELFEQSREWRNFLAFLGVFMLLWFKLVYKL